MKKLTLLLALLAAALSISCSDAAIRTQLTRADAGRGLTRHQLLRRMARRSKARAARLLSATGSSSPATASAVPGMNQPLDTEYVVSFAIGTPPQPVQATLDTGSDLIWTQCQPCPSCFDQTLPYYDPSLSSTSAVLPCNSSACQQLPISSCGAQWWGTNTCVYTYSYGDKSGDAAVPGLAFGCGLFNNGVYSANTTGTGIAGFGRGALSLPSQLKVDNFSYCFTDITGSTPSPVLLGLPENLYAGATGAVQTTPLIQSSDNPTFYYLSLKGITVGSTRLAVPESAFALTKNGTGGTIIDSGTAVTSLPPRVYGLLHDAFVSQVKLPVTSDEPLCFAVPSAAAGKKQEVPKLVLHFEGATLDLPRENYVFEVDEGGQSNMCIAIFSSGGDMTTIGNYQQQNLHVLYDLAGNKLSFVPAHCDKV
ncbi:hypothetical protein HU200_044883 [Digitaria exilis]|uniref:Peptidase A1 domain-containing protein n=1 Tax=Digitaria exilis TaxID=1010633 RepID=A0A835B4H5_9POAL|nr:hypothetical protein HU200_044883 [Digitaria exilis]